MIGMFKGMATTISHLWKPNFNAGYPNVPKTLPARSRSSFMLPLGDDGLPRCKSCLACEKSCPDSAIVIESEKNPDGPGRVLQSFTIDLGLCMYCGICVENCTSSGLSHTGDFENVSHVRSDMRLVLYQRSGSGPAAVLDSTAGASNEAADVADSPVGDVGPSSGLPSIDEGAER